MNIRILQQKSVNFERRQLRSKRKLGWEWICSRLKQQIINQLSWVESRDRIVFKCCNLFHLVYLPATSTKLVFIPRSMRFGDDWRCIFSLIDLLCRFWVDLLCLNVFIASDTSILMSPLNITIRVCSLSFAMFASMFISRSLSDLQMSIYDFQMWSRCGDFLTSLTWQVCELFNAKSCVVHIHYSSHLMALKLS